MKLKLFAVLPLILISSAVYAGEQAVVIHSINESGVSNAIGNIYLSDSDNGLALTPSFKGLSAGLHGIHIHTNPSCDAAMKDGKSVAGLAAGGHYDPNNSNKHEGPAGAGHNGDLPALLVNADEEANTAITAPRLKVADIINRAIIIHEGGDNYSDTPKPLGGGAGRIACGIIK